MCMQALGRADLLHHPAVPRTCHRATPPANESICSFVRSAAPLARPPARPPRLLARAHPSAGYRSRYISASMSV